MQDGIMFYKELAVKPNFNTKEDYILCTIHRAENTDNEVKLRSIFDALNEIANEKQIILPLHPRIKKIIKNLKLNIDNLKIIESVGYLEMVWLINNFNLVMTDNGGLQKEAHFFKNPCITLRNETKWLELVEYGVNKHKIIEEYTYSKDFNSENFNLDLYYIEKSSKNIVKELHNG